MMKYIENKLRRYPRTGKVQPDGRSTKEGSEGSLSLFLFSIPTRKIILKRGPVSVIKVGLIPSEFSPNRIAAKELRSGTQLAVVD